MENALDRRVVQIRRVTKAREGGRDFSFSALVVSGRSGQIGIGCGKAKEVLSAVEKATRIAERNMTSIRLRGDTLQHPMETSYGATTVILRPASKGTGIIAGGTLRAMFEVLGVKNVVTKCIGSTNPINVIKAALIGLNTMVSPKMIANKRGKSVQEILGRDHNE